MRQQNLVVLKGTWERTDTSRGEVTDYRRLIRVTALQESLGVLKVVASKPENTGRYSRETRHGTFEFAVQVRGNMSRWSGRPSHEKVLVGRAKRTLKELCQDLTCRSPKFTVTSVRVYHPAEVPARFRGIGG